VSPLAIERDAVLSGFETLAPASPHIAQMRHAALRRFQELGIPTTRDEGWKYTSLQTLLRTDFHRGSGQNPPRLSELSLPDLEGTSVFVDGVMQGSGPIQSLRSGFGNPRLEGILGTLAPWKDDAFAALNTAFLEDGAWIDVEPGTSAPRVVLAHLTSGGRITHPRTLIHVGKGGSASVVEIYGGRPGETYFANPVTEVFLDEGASLDLVRVQLESERAFHIERVFAKQSRSSRLSCRNFNFGAALFRSDIQTLFDGPGGECDLEGLFVARGEQHTDSATRIIHAQPHCSSREVYKGILSGRSRGAFLGTIVVEKDAQKTDAHQTNRNLLLSPEALVTSVPRLEILADDVKCRHGSATGRLDPNALFYLQSRGIALDDARNLLVRAFGGDLIERVTLKPLQDALLIELVSRLGREGVEGRL
jgi:Fe-S cluster assembly protein SufD